MPPFRGRIKKDQTHRARGAQCAPRTRLSRTVRSDGTENGMTEYTERQQAPTEELLQAMAAEVAAPSGEREETVASIDEQVRVSVIMPVFNAAQYLPAALDSLLSQTLTEIEIICVDDGSTDGCLEILKQYRERDARVRIVTENNAGPSRARNNGLRRARGVYVAFMDADDFCESTWLEHVHALAEATQADIAVAGYDLYRESIRRFAAPIASEEAAAFAAGCAVSRSDLPDVLFQITDGYAWSKLFRNSFLREKALAFPEDVFMFEDAYFVATALSVADRLARCDEVLLHHRVYSDQVRNRTFPKHYAQVVDVFVRLRAFLVSHGMYLPLSASYLQYSATRCFKVYNLLALEEKGILWNRLHEQLEPLGWGGDCHTAVRDADASDFLSAVGRYTYEQYYPRLVRGLKLRPPRVRRAKGFFASLFGRRRGKTQDG